MRNIRYEGIARALREQVEAGEFVGGQLPSESELVTAYDASRVTVRKALEALRQEGLIEARHGVGWFVPAHRFRQSLARLGTIEAQLAASGVTPERRILDFGMVQPRGRVRHVLGPARLLQVKRLNLADGEPFARVTVWCPARLAIGISRDDIERSSFYDLLSVELGGAKQTIGAQEASKSDARILGIVPGAAVLRCERQTVSTSGEVVLFSEHIFPAHRTEFVVDLPRADVSVAPQGLRLVEASNDAQ